MEMIEQICIEDIIGEVCGYKMNLKVLNKFNLRKQIKDELTRRVCETKNAEIILAYASQMLDLSIENINELTKIISKTEAPEQKCDFLLDVQNLTEENEDILIKSIFEIEEPEIIKNKTKILEK